MKRVINKIISIIYTVKIFVVKFYWLVKRLLYVLKNIIKFNFYRVYYNFWIVIRNFFFLYLCFKILVFNNEIIIMLAFLFIVAALYFNFKGALYEQFNEKVNYLFFEFKKLLKIKYILSYKIILLNNKYYNFFLNIYKNLFLIYKKFYNIFISNYFYLQEYIYFNSKGLIESRAIYYLILNDLNKFKQNQKELKYFNNKFQIKKLIVKNWLF